MYNKQQKIPLSIVHYYLNNGTSLRRTAQMYDIHYQTLFKWVKLYKNNKKERLLSTYKRPWNRTPEKLEKKMVLLKENNPCLTVRKAKEILEKDGINISIKGIWGIWKRYGYAGFDIKNMGTDFTTYCPWSREARESFEQAKGIYNPGNIKKSAELLNSIPSLPANDLLSQIPDSYLCLRRRVEKISFLNEKIPLHSYLKKVRGLYEECKKRGLYYSALRLGISESVALTWQLEPMGLLKRNEELKNMLNRTENHFCLCSSSPWARQTGSRKSNPFALRFPLLIQECMAYAALSRIRKATEIARYCRRLLRRRKHISPYHMLEFGTLNTYFDDFREAEYWYLRFLESANREESKAIQNHLADIYSYKGEYKKAIKKLKDIGKSWAYCIREVYYESMYQLSKGKPQKAISLSAKLLSLAKKEEVNWAIIRAYFIIASSYSSLGERAKAENVLKRALPFVHKKLKRAETAFKIFLSGKTKDEHSIKLNKDLLPTVRLALLLKNGDYVKAFRCAMKKGILSYLHRDIFFFPEAVTGLLEKGKPTGLPKSMLRLPVFNKKVPVYNIKFLGKLFVHKNQKYIKVNPVRKKLQVVLSDSFKSKPGASLVSGVRRKFSNGVKLQPKDTAFLIQLALKAGEPGNEISLEDLYKNFWKNSKNPARNLSHLLVRVKNTINLPSHLLEVSYKRDNPILINKGIHFITDYDEFQQSLAQAKALERAGEWDFAKREYLRAFRLFHGEPFRKMYDNWSEHMRRVVLNKLETEAIRFAKSCIAHDNEIRQKKRRTPSAKYRGANMADAKKVLEKVLKIIPQSEESQKLLETL
jgi:transposase/tetratricopeptide (TPR) repeat protein